ncbi:hypothetical protein VCR12J2_590050 [Vibrio coralliirubri]|nr:hypothetical protein VCR12J2_590050 [Vibrio coralliirubri]
MIHVTRSTLSSNLLSHELKTDDQRTSEIKKRSLELRFYLSVLNDLSNEQV